MTDTGRQELVVGRHRIILQVEEVLYVPEQDAEPTSIRPAIRVVNDDGR
jgi:hypothetical protein